MRDEQLAKGTEAYAAQISEAVQQKAARQWALWTAKGQPPLWYVIKARLRPRQTGPFGDGSGRPY